MDSKNIQTVTDSRLTAIRGAVARGWCAEANAHKVMDGELAEAIAQEVMALGILERNTTQDQLDKLGGFILEHIPGEPSQNEGAVETAIRLLRDSYVPVARQDKEREQLKAAFTDLRNKALAEAAQAMTKDGNVREDEEGSKGLSAPPPAKEDGRIIVGKAHAMSKGGRVIIITALPSPAGHNIKGFIAGRREPVEWYDNGFCTLADSQLDMLKDTLVFTVSRGPEALRFRHPSNRETQG